LLSARSASCAANGEEAEIEGSLSSGCILGEPDARREVRGYVFGFRVGLDMAYIEEYVLMMGSDAYLYFRAHHAARLQLKLNARKPPLESI
jgi:hypothetical protein